MGRTAPRKAGRVAALCGVLTAGLAGCGPRSPAPPASVPASTNPSADAGFVAPPSLTVALRRADGGVRIEGRAPADALVRLLSPETGASGVTADGQGGWSIELPPAAQPRLFALSAESGGRVLRGEGALAVMPAPAAPALLLRGGTAALAIDDRRGGVRLAAVDFDAGGGVGAAGLAAPGAEVRLGVDGAATGEGRADARGLFSLLAVRAPLTPGGHTVRVDTPQGSAEAAVITTPPSALGDRPYAVQRLTNGWRIDWAPPGGGVQSVTVLDLAGPAR